MLVCLVANRMHVPGDSNSKGKRQFPLPAEKSLCHFWDAQVQQKIQRPLLVARRDFETTSLLNLHPPPSAIKHQSHKCLGTLGKAFPKLPRRLPFCKKVQCKPNATNAWVDKWTGLLRFDMHAGSSEILIHPPWLKSLIFYGTLFPTWTRPCEIAVFSNHLQDWNLWFFKVTFLGWVLNFVGGSLWDLPLCLKLGSQIVPQPGPTKMKNTAVPPTEAQLFFWSQANSA